jgi:hypothetical protein
MSSLSRSAATCDLCSLLDSACKRDGLVKGEHIQVERSQSNLKLSSSDLPILSILRSPGRSYKKFLLHVIDQSSPCGNIACAATVKALDEANNIDRAIDSDPNTAWLPSITSTWLYCILQPHQALAPRL